MKAEMKKVKGKAGQGNTFWDALLVSWLQFQCQCLEAIDLSSPLLFDLTFSILITLQKVLKYDSAQNASDARREISEE
jgi:hypothetical protein